VVRIVEWAIDYSVETRLTSHFMDFGPFIAVGFPNDTRPRIGAMF
jgi:hypothetical protein